MVSFNEFKKEIEDVANFQLFTKLLKAKIVGGLLSEEKLTKQERDIIKNVGFVEQRIIFDCPCCGHRQHANINEEEVECDCGELINLKTISKENRYILQENILNDLKDLFSKENNEFIFVFGEKSIHTLNRNSKVHLHISPFLNTDKKFECLDDAHLDHFSIDWGLFPSLLDDTIREEFLSEISRFREEEIKKQIDWNKITSYEFQRMVSRLLLKKGFHRIVPGGTGSDQGKDIIAEEIEQSSTGKKIHHRWLVQCKKHKKNVGVNEISTIDDLSTHKCDSYLLVTTSYPSGQLVTKLQNIENDPKNNIRSCDIWDKDILFDLLKQYPEIRIDYFYKTNKKVKV